ncbi:MAG: PqqD family protein [Proteobacteria bacterium]|nr:PqqD family protein [Pseudomonadota bacterium]
MNRHHPQQWHDVVAKRTVEWEDGPEDRAVLLVPRFRRGPLARWLQPRLKRPHMRVKLDDLGTFVWRRLDGNTPFDEIAKAMEGHFGERAAPADQRLKAFFTILHKDRFVELYAPSAGRTE